ncbi:hypothetical protein [Enterococcus phage vB_EfaP_Ef6.2]|uniref:Uncharacterized protein n=1 Tax=Enterococcus phage vB_EfaP_Ef6.2 TaxID=2546621 RepID=A0A4D6DSG7_9CAUD|nr:hypothetical protein H3T65_gp02 [Enterococcus phage vB_EfaP_Ef6.2]QBZ69174.1 hypothetical protein [Enterococcus phage vB_EfaP_Ef6.2]
MKVKIINPTQSDLLKGIAYGTKLEVFNESNGFVTVKYFNELVSFSANQIEYI